MPRTRRRAAAAATEKIKCLTGPEAVENKESQDEIVGRVPAHKKKVSLLLPPPPSIADVRSVSRGNSPVPSSADVGEEVLENESCSLPMSSGDLLISNELIMSVLSIHEFLRVFGRPLRLAPFRFEDLCASMLVDERSTLSSEIYLALMRCLLAEDDLCSIQYAANDERESANLQWAVLDTMTWPATLMAYLRADPEFLAANASIVNDVRSGWLDYPAVPVQHHVTVLAYLCARASETALIHQCVNFDMQFESEDHCRACSRLGDMVCCDRCPAVYHLHCLKPPLAEVPEGDWTCPSCIAIQNSDVNDAIIRTALRHTPVGTDKWGRRYWHLARRVFVETQDGCLVAYYSQKEHLEELIQCLRDNDDPNMADLLVEAFDDIINDMAVTAGWISAARLVPAVNHIEMPAKVHTIRSESPLSSSATCETPAILATPAALGKPSSSHSISHRDVDVVQPTSTEAQCTSNQATLEERPPAQSAPPPSAAAATSVVPGVATPPPVPAPADSAASAASAASSASADSQATTSGASDAESFTVTSKSADPTADSAVPSSCDGESQSITNGPVMFCTTNAGPLSNPQPFSERAAQSVSPASEAVMVPDAAAPAAVGSDRGDAGSLSFQLPAVDHPDRNSLVPDSLVPDMETTSMTGTSSTPDNSTKNLVESSSSPMSLPGRVPAMFQLGCEGHFRGYSNIYALSKQALGKLVHQEDTEHRKARFGQFSSQNMTWSGAMTGGKRAMAATLRSSLLHMEASLPFVAKSSLWYKRRPHWLRAVELCHRPHEFSVVLCHLLRSLRATSFREPWQKAIGCISLRRRQQQEWDVLEATAKRNGGSLGGGGSLKERAEAEGTAFANKKEVVNYSSIPLRHHVWKQRGEEYRVFGGGWQFVSTRRRVRAATTLKSISLRKAKAKRLQTAVERGLKFLSTQTDGARLRQAGKKHYNVIYLKPKAEVDAVLSLSNAPGKTTDGRSTSVSSVTATLHRPIRPLILDRSSSGGPLAMSTAALERTPSLSTGSRGASLTTTPRQSPAVSPVLSPMTLTPRIETSSLSKTTRLTSLNTRLPSSLTLLRPSTSTSSSASDAISPPAMPSLPKGLVLHSFHSFKAPQAVSSEITKAQSISGTNTGAGTLVSSKSNPVSIAPTNCSIPCNADGSVRPAASTIADTAVIASYCASRGGGNGGVCSGASTVATLPSPSQPVSTSDTTAALSTTSETPPVNQAVPSLSMSPSSPVKAEAPPALSEKDPHISSCGNETAAPAMQLTSVQDGVTIPVSLSTSTGTANSTLTPADNLALSSTSTSNPGPVIPATANAISSAATMTVRSVHSTDVTEESATPAISSSSNDGTDVAVSASTESKPPQSTSVSVSSPVNTAASKTSVSSAVSLLAGEVSVSSAVSLLAGEVSVSSAVSLLAGEVSVSSAVNTLASEASAPGTPLSIPSTMQSPAHSNSSAVSDSLTSVPVQSVVEASASVADITPASSMPTGSSSLAVSVSQPSRTCLPSFSSDLAPLQHAAVSAGNHLSSLSDMSMCLDTDPSMLADSVAHLANRSNASLDGTIPADLLQAPFLSLSTGGDSKLATVSGKMSTFLRADEIGDLNVSLEQHISNALANGTLSTQSDITLSDLESSGLSPAANSQQSHKSSGVATPSLTGGSRRSSATTTESTVNLSDFATANNLNVLDDSLLVGLDSLPMDQLMPSDEMLDAADRLSAAVNDSSTATADQSSLSSVAHSPGSLSTLPAAVDVSVSSMSQPGCNVQSAGSAALPPVESILACSPRGSGEAVSPSQLPSPSNTGSSPSRASPSSSTTSDIGRIEALPSQPVVSSVVDLADCSVPAGSDDVIVATASLPGDDDDQQVDDSALCSLAERNLPTLSEPDHSSVTLSSTNPEHSMAVRSSEELPPMLAITSSDSSGGGDPLPSVAASSHSGPSAELPLPDMSSTTGTSDSSALPSLPPQSPRVADSLADTVTSQSPLIQQDAGQPTTVAVTDSVCVWDSGEVPMDVSDAGTVCGQESPSGSTISPVPMVTGSHSSDAVTSRNSPLGTESHVLASSSLIGTESHVLASSSLIGSVLIQSHAVGDPLSETKGNSPLPVAMDTEPVVSEASDLSLASTSLVDTTISAATVCGNVQADTLASSSTHPVPVTSSSLSGAVVSSFDNVSNAVCPPSSECVTSQQSVSSPAISTSTSSACVAADAGQAVTTSITVTDSSVSLAPSLLDVLSNVAAASRVAVPATSSASHADVQAENDEQDDLSKDSSSTVANITSALPASKESTDSDEVFVTTSSKHASTDSSVVSLVSAASLSSASTSTSSSSSTLPDSVVAAHSKVISSAIQRMHDSKQLKPNSHIQPLPSSSQSSSLLTGLPSTSSTTAATVELTSTPRSRTTRPPSRSQARPVNLLSPSTPTTRLLSPGVLRQRMADTSLRWRRSGSSQTVFSCLSRQQLRRLARRAGQMEVGEFVASKGVNSVGSSLLPLVSPRPTFSHVWLYHTQSATSLNTIALQLRMLYASLRWESLLNRSARGPPMQITTRADGTTITKEIAARRDLDVQGLSSEYLLMVSVKHAGSGHAHHSRSQIDSASTPKGTPRSQRASKSAANTLLASFAAEENLDGDEDPEESFTPTSNGGMKASATWLHQSRLSMLLLRQFCDLYERRRAQIQQEEAAQRLEDARLQQQAQLRAQQLAAAQAEKEVRQKRIAEQLRRHELLRQKHEKQRQHQEQQKKLQQAAARKAQEVANQIAAKRAKLAAAAASVTSRQITAAAISKSSTPSVPMATTSQTSSSQRMYLLQVSGHNQPILVWLPENATKASIQLPGRSTPTVVDIPNGAQALSQASSSSEQLAATRDLAQHLLQQQVTRMQRQQQLQEEEAKRIQDEEEKRVKENVALTPVQEEQRRQRLATQQQKQALAKQQQQRLVDLQAMLAEQKDLQQQQKQGANTPAQTDVQQPVKARSGEQDRQKNLQAQLTQQQQLQQQLRVLTASGGMLSDMTKVTTATRSQDSPTTSAAVTTTAEAESRLQPVAMTTSSRSKSFNSRSSTSRPLVDPGVKRAAELKRGRAYMLNKRKDSLRKELLKRRNTIMKTARDAPPVVRPVLVASNTVNRLPALPLKPAASSTSSVSMTTGSPASMMSSQLYNLAAMAASDLPQSLPVTVSKHSLSDIGHPLVAIASTNAMSPKRKRICSSSDSVPPGTASVDHPSLLAGPTAGGGGRGGILLTTSTAGEEHVSWTAAVTTAFESFNSPGNEADENSEQQQQQQQQQQPQAVAVPTTPPKPAMKLSSKSPPASQQTTKKVSTPPLATSSTVGTVSSTISSPDRVDNTAATSTATPMKSLTPSLTNSTKDGDVPKLLSKSNTVAKVISTPSPVKHAITMPTWSIQSPKSSVATLPLVSAIPSASAQVDSAALATTACNFVSSPEAPPCFIDNNQAHDAVEVGSNSPKKDKHGKKKKKKKKQKTSDEEEQRLLEELEQMQAKKSRMVAELIEKGIVNQDTSLDVTTAPTCSHGDTTHTPTTKSKVKSSTSGSKSKKATKDSDGALSPPPVTTPKKSKSSTSKHSCGRDRNVKFSLPPADPIFSALSGNGKVTGKHIEISASSAQEPPRLLSPTAVSKGKKRKADSSAGDLSPLLSLAPAAKKSRRVQSSAARDAYLLVHSAHPATVIPAIPVAHATDESEKTRKGVRKSSSSKSTKSNIQSPAGHSCASVTVDTSSSDLAMELSTADTSDDLLCLCRTPYDASRFYIGCDQCNEWFHGECVDISPEEADSIANYHCQSCLEKGAGRKSKAKGGTHVASTGRSEVSVVSFVSDTTEALDLQLPGTGSSRQRELSKKKLKKGKVSLSAGASSKRKMEMSTEDCEAHVAISSKVTSSSTAESSPATLPSSTAESSPATLPSANSGEAVVQTQHPCMELPVATAVPAVPATAERAPAMPAGVSDEVTESNITRPASGGTVRQSKRARKANPRYQDAQDVAKTKSPSATIQQAVNESTSSGRSVSPLATLVPSSPPSAVSTSQESLAKAVPSVDSEDSGDAPVPGTGSNDDDVSLQIKHRGARSQSKTAPSQRLKMETPYDSAACEVPVEKSPSISVIPGRVSSEERSPSRSSRRTRTSKQSTSVASSAQFSPPAVLALEGQTVHIVPETFSLPSSVAEVEVPASSTWSSSPSSSPETTVSSALCPSPILSVPLPTASEVIEPPTTDLLLSDRDDLTHIQEKDEEEVRVYIPDLSNTDSSPSTSLASRGSSSSKLSSAATTRRPSVGTPRTMSSRRAARSRKHDESSSSQVPLSTLSAPTPHNKDEGSSLLVGTESSDSPSSSTATRRMVGSENETGDAAGLAPTLYECRICKKPIDPESAFVNCLKCLLPVHITCYGDSAVESSGSDRLVCPDCRPTNAEGHDTLRTPGRRTRHTASKTGTPKETTPKTSHATRSRPSSSGRKGQQESSDVVEISGCASTSAGEQSMSRTSSKKAKSLALPEKPALTVPASDGDVVATVVSRKRKADSQTPVTDGIVSSGLAKLPAPTSAGRRSRRSGASAMHDLPCGKKLLAKDSAALHQAVQELLSKDEAWPFRDRDTMKHPPGYLSTMQPKMDLCIVEANLSRKSYQTLGDVVVDMSTIFSTCRQHNPLQSVYVRCADAMEAMFVQIVHDWLSL